MPKTWIGVSCPGCGHVTPILAACRILKDGDAITTRQLQELHRVADQGVSCPCCQCDLREGVPTPSSPPLHIDVRP